MNVDAVAEFLGWCTVISFGVMTIQSLAILSLRDWMTRLHARMFRLDEDSLRRSYFQYLALFKIAVIVFNFVPYIALKIMAGS